MPTPVLVPPLGQTVDTMTFVAWLKREGELVQQGDPLYAIETDKATLEIEAPATGILGGTSAQQGDEVKALASIAIILEVERGEASGDAAPPGRLLASPRARRLAEAEEVPLARVSPTGPEGSVVERDVRAFLQEQSAAPMAAAGTVGNAGPPPSPLARRLAEEESVDLAALTGTGPRGQVMREDVEAALAARRGATGASAGADEAPIEIIPLTGARRLTAERMSASSRETAPVTLTSEADATEFVRLRERLAADGAPVSVSDLLMYTLASTLRQHPRMNASLENDCVRVWSQINIGLAVETERGLLVPVLRHVDRKGLSELAAESARLIERARAGKSVPEELRGGTFTVTNLGMFGIDAFTPIINLPECAILGFGRIKTEPVWVEDHVEPRQRVWLSLTFDHRLVDGGPAARFLQTVARLLEKPHLLMV